MDKDFICPKVSFISEAAAWTNGEKMPTISGFTEHYKHVNTFWRIKIERILVKKKSF